MESTTIKIEKLPLFIPEFNKLLFGHSEDMGPAIPFSLIGILIASAFTAVRMIPLHSKGIVLQGKQAIWELHKRSYGA